MELGRVLTEDEEISKYLRCFSLPTDWGSSIIGLPRKSSTRKHRA
uniref:Uncharacterized protein n=1 Tax=Arundo donax TaxID=35708 RepID=A0A0A9FJF6_ARUDO